VTDEEALEAFRVCSECEGIIPALESAHALAYLLKSGERMSGDEVVVMCMSGRGDKDVYEVAEKMGMDV
jgi:tryptophan synthase beta chain